jgi:hypothetical protein
MRDRQRFGEIGIDGDLILDTKEELFEMNNGCVCCTVRASSSSPQSRAGRAAAGLRIVRGGAVTGGSAHTPPHAMLGRS